MERMAGRIILLWGWRRALAAFLAGAVAVLTQAPFDFFAAGFLSFPILVWLLDGAAVAAPAGLIRRFMPSFWIGWWFGFGYFLAGLWWIGNALLVEADSFAWALPFAVLGIPLILAVFHGMAALIGRIFWSNNIGRIAALAFGFGLTEWLRSFVLTGFPWIAVGYGVMPVPLLMQSVSITGIVGMNALAVFVFSMPGLMAARRDRRFGIAVALVLCVAHAGFGYWRLGLPAAADGKSLAVRIVQPAVSMSEKWVPAEQSRVFDAMIKDSASPPEAGQAKPQLIVWPETSVPFLFTDRPEALTQIGSMLSPDQLLLAGAVRFEAGGPGEEDRYYNSVVAIDHGGQIVDGIDKVHLVPFGEYLPASEFFDRIGIGQLVAGPTYFVAGSARHPLKLPGGLSAAAFICYEIIFPDLVSVDAASSDIIVNVTNDAWFGATPGPYQHFRLAQVRAVEAGLTVVRAANTGISGIIDAKGRIIDALAMGSHGHMDATVTIEPHAELLPFSPRTTGLGIICFFALLATAMRIRQRLVSI